MTDAPLIAILDDEPEIRRLLVDYLARAGAKVTLLEASDQLGGLGRK